KTNSKSIMMKIFYLDTCNTCQRIIKEIDHETQFEYQNIKTNPVLAADLDFFKEKTGSYESLFNRRAMKYRSMNLKDQNLQEADYRKLILEEYTFLKRPVVVIGEDIFVGNAKKTVEAAKKRLAAMDAESTQNTEAQI
ncbi:MAG: ArsC/Spx/MgsR family protein, partial [Bacteroidota bacterium]